MSDTLELYGYRVWSLGPSLPYKVISPEGKVLYVDEAEVLTACARMPISEYPPGEKECRVAYQLAWSFWDSGGQQ